ncbi:peptidoglycan-binding protein [Streptomyces sp. NPDC048644]|uniref:peptidoglycan-binding domain-containing protein n=1 Tax=Streptomyces sp. NPDC048644 TaxID=3365582 RepID=UPI003711854B
MTVKATTLRHTARRSAVLAVSAGLMTAGLLAVPASAAGPAEGPAGPMAACAYYSGSALTVHGQLNDRVRQVQCLLANRKYLPWSSLTGYFGDKTLAAVKKFQKAKHLTADGRVGKKTWKALSS